MHYRKQLRSLAAAGTLVGAVALLPDCSAADLANASKGCDGLASATAKADVTVKAFADAATALKARALEVEQQWYTICHAINLELGLDEKGGKTAAEVCAVTNKRVADALAKGVTITLEVGGSCQADLTIQANCEASCYASASCDIRAKCEPGKLVVECNGSCDATCDVRAPSFECSGKCEGSCTATTAVSCTATCEGKCDAPSWEGTCEAGCTASFTGTCGGHCEGKCDGTATAGSATGNCAGKCEGSCTAQATGKCSATCTGTYKEGKCTGQCTGKCTGPSIDCKGTCNGTCSYTPGAATCKGQCHGKCTAEVSPPRCEGKIDCQVDANCTASCKGKAEAKVSCEGHANWIVEGDAKLYNALVKQADALGAAFKATLALSEQIVNLAKTVGPAIKSIGDLSATGAVCIGSSLTVIADAQVSVNVSVQASASVQGKASTS